MQRSCHSCFCQYTKSSLSSCNCEASLCTLLSLILYPIIQKETSEWNTLNISRSVLDHCRKSTLLRELIHDLSKVFIPGQQWKWMPSFNSVLIHAYLAQIWVPIVKVSKEESDSRKLFLFYLQSHLGLSFNYPWLTLHTNIFIYFFIF